MKIYALGDIHACLNELIAVMKKIKLNPDDKIIFLGDYIDRGPDSKKVLEYLKNFQDNNPNNVIVLKGNHEFYLEEWIKDDIPAHLGMGINDSIKSFFQNEKEYKSFSKDFDKLNRLEIEKRMKNYLLDNHKQLLDWIFSLPYYYETDKQIFVHAGIEEEAEDLWQFGTPDYMFVEKVPATFGYFYKDIIAGHISTATITKNENFHNIYYDGQSHFYCDGETPYSGKLPVLIYDYKEDEYLSMLDGKIEIIKK